MATLYEILTIINPDETDDGVDAIIGGLRQQLINSGGEIVAVDVWGRRKLAYPIKKKEEGVYVLMHVEGPVNLPAEFRAHTKIRESIFRELVLKLTDAQEAAVRTALEEAGPEDEKIAAAQIAAADERAADKRAQLAASMSEQVAEAEEGAPAEESGPTEESAEAAAAAAEVTAGEIVDAAPAETAEEAAPEAAEEMGAEGDAEGEPEAAAEAGADELAAEPTAERADEPAAEPTDEPTGEVDTDEDESEKES